MKKILSPLSGILIIIFISILFVSCRKIDTGKLSGNWKVVKLDRSFEYKNQKYETTFDGEKKTDTYTVKDSVITVANPTPHDSTITYVRTQTYTGNISTDYHTKGSYYYEESFKNDTTGVTVTIEIDGLWYFTSGNHDSGYGQDKLLAMQAGKFTYNSNSGTIHTTIFQGENTLDIYEISTLKNDKVVLKINTSETINFVQYVTIMEFTLEPR